MIHRIIISLSPSIIAISTFCRNNLSTRSLALTFRCCCGKRCVQAICFVLVAVIVFEILIFNFAAFYIYKIVGNEILQLASADRGVSILDTLLNYERTKHFAAKAKYGGLIKMYQETIDRLYIVKERVAVKNESDYLQDLGGRKMKEISFLGLDVSHSLESTYIYQRITTRRKFPFYSLIVDIGANDGLVSSNSFNFIRWGWDAVLVEPQIDQLNMARNNVFRFVDPYSENNQRVEFVQAAIAESDGPVEFSVRKDTFGTESHLADRGIKNAADISSVVPGMTVKTLAMTYHVPKKFGILSIDAEGMGVEILTEWMALKFNPAYVIFEKLHPQEPLSETFSRFEKWGYHMLGARGWNIIFEHNSLEAV